MSMEDVRGLFDESQGAGSVPTAPSAARSSRPEVRNPLVELPAFRRLQALDAPTRAALRELLLELRQQARERGDELWRRNKPWSGVYWRVVAVYVGHVARLLRDGAIKR
jgi:hypothetical protein